jgi:pilus assembly protein CpaC
MAKQSSLKAKDEAAEGSCCSSLMLFLAALLLLAGLFAPVSADAQTRRISLGGGNVSNVTVPPGSTLTIQTDISFANIVVGAPDIADVVPLNERSLYIQGKGSGSTTVSIYDGRDELLGVLDVLVELDFDQLASDIRAAVPGARITVSNVNNRIRLSGVVKNGRDLSRALEIAQQYAGDDRPVLNQLRVADAQQVSLEVRIIEAKRTAGRDLGLGIQGAGVPGLFTVNGRTGITTNDDDKLAYELKPGLTQNGLPFGQAIAKVLEFAGFNIDIVINALEAKGLVRRLAQPNLITVSGAPAEFHAGGEVPILTAVSGNGTTATQTDYRPYGVRLSFTPTVLEDGLINLVISPEVSEIDRSVNVNGNPGFTSRKATTTVELRDGQSFAIAGLLQTVNSSDVQQMPWLGQVPVLGTLFRSTSFQKQESDLVIVVTPRLVRPAGPDENLATPLDKTRPGNDVEVFLLGMLEVDKKMLRDFKEGNGIIGPYGHIIDLDFGGANAIAKK